MRQIDGLVEVASASGGGGGGGVDGDDVVRKGSGGGSGDKMRIRRFWLRRRVRDANRSEFGKRSLRRQLTMMGVAATSEARRVSWKRLVEGTM